MMKSFMPHRNFWHRLCSPAPIAMLMTNIYLCVAVICAICYWMVGYSVAYTAGNSFIGYSGWFGAGVGEDKHTFWVFQFIFASTASTILSGSVAERCSFVTYIAYSSIISGGTFTLAEKYFRKQFNVTNNLKYLLDSQE